MTKGQRRYYMLISLLGVVISILFLRKFYLFTPEFFPEALFVPYKSSAILPEWRQTGIFLTQLGIVVSVLLSISLVFVSDKYVKKIALTSIIAALVIGNSFYFIHKEYNYKYHPYLFGYMSIGGNYIGNPERYFEVIERYGFDGDSYRPFKTLDDAIKGLDFAKEKKNGMYGYIFRDLEVFGYEEVFKKYDDVYFQLYFASEMIRDLGYAKNDFFIQYKEKLLDFQKYIGNEKIKGLYSEIYQGYEKLKSKDPNYNDEMSIYDNLMKDKIETLFKQFGY